MDDLTQREADITADLWKQVERIDRTLNSFRNALEHAGPGSSVTTVADVLLCEAMELLKTAAKGEGFTDAARMI